MANKNELKGIGGWLLIPTIGLIIISIMYLSLTLIYIYSLLFIEFLFEDLLMFIILGTIAYLSTYCLILEFKHKKEFPRWFKFYLWFAIVLIFLMEFLIGFEGTIEETIGEYLWAFLFVIIWTAYMNKSKRVKNTFVK